MKMKRFIPAILLLIFSCANSHAQSWDQAARFGAAERETPLKMVVDANDNLYILGYFESPTLSFDANTTLTLDGSTEQDYFLAKYNANFEFQWAQRFGPGAKRFGSGILSLTVGLDLAPNGDPIVVLNMTGDTVDIANTQVAFNDVMFEDWVRAGVIRLDAANGHVVWSRFPEQYGANDPINGPYFTSLTINAQGEIFVGGTVSDVGITIDTSSVSLPIGTTNETSVFAFSLNSNGSSRWAQLLYHNDGSSDLFISGFPTHSAVGSDGGVYLGWYDSDGSGTATATNDGHHMQKLSPADGSRQWSKYLSTLKGAGDKWLGWAPLADGTIMAAFTFREIVDLGSGVATPNDENEPGVLAHIAADGTARSVRQMRNLISGPYFSGGNFLLDPFDISEVNTNGQFLLTGSFYGDLPLSNGTTLTGEKLNGVLPGEDVLVLELDTALNIRGTLQAGSNNRDRGTGIAYSSTGTALVTGDFLLNPAPVFQGPIAFDAIELTSVGRHDVFIAEGTPGLSLMSIEDDVAAPQLLWQQQGKQLLIKSAEASLESLQLYNLQGQFLGELAPQLRPGEVLRWETAGLKGLLLLTAVRDGRMVTQKVLLN